MASNELPVADGFRTGENHKASMASRSSSVVSVVLPSRDAVNQHIASTDIRHTLVPIAPREGYFPALGRQNAPRRRPNRRSSPVPRIALHGVCHGLHPRCGCDGGAEIPPRLAGNARRRAAHAAIASRLPPGSAIRGALGACPPAIPPTLKGRADGLKGERWKSSIRLDRARIARLRFAAEA